jgi:hypothetical protein
MICEAHRSIDEAAHGDRLPALDATTGPKRSGEEARSERVAVRVDPLANWLPAAAAGDDAAVHAVFGGVAPAVAAMPELDGGNVDAG